AAGGVAVERSITSGCVAAADCVESERGGTVGRVVAAGRVEIERTSTNSRVVEAGCVVKERVVTQERVLVEDVAAFLANRSRFRRKPKAGEGKRDEKESKPQRRPVH